MKSSLATYRGFTLVEILLYIAISSGVVLGAFQVFQFFDATSYRHAAIAAVDTEAAFLTQRFQDILRAGTAILPGPQESSDTLQVSDDTVVSLAGTTVMVQRTGNESRPLTSQRVAVDGLMFRNLAASNSPDIIQVIFTMRASPSEAFAAGAPLSHDYIFTIGTR